MKLTRCKFNIYKQVEKGEAIYMLYTMCVLFTRDGYTLLWKPKSTSFGYKLHKSRAVRKLWL